MGSSVGFVRAETVIWPGYWLRSAGRSLGACSVGFVRFRWLGVPIFPILLGTTLNLGCSNPTEDLLPVGSKVVLSSRAGKSIQVWTRLPGGPTDRAYDRLVVEGGTQAVVVADAPVALPKQSMLRLTRVRLVDAGLAGVEVDVSRYKLRKVP